MKKMPCELHFHFRRWDLWRTRMRTGPKKFIRLHIQRKAVRQVGDERCIQENNAEVHMAYLLSVAVAPTCCLMQQTTGPPHWRKLCRCFCFVLQTLEPPTQQRKTSRWRSFYLPCSVIATCLSLVPLNNTNHLLASCNHTILCDRRPDKNYTEQNYKSAEEVKGREHSATDRGKTNSKQEMHDCQD